MVGTVATAVPVFVAALVFLARRVYAQSRKRVYQRSAE